MESPCQEAHQSLGWESATNQTTSSPPCFYHTHWNGEWLKSWGTSLTPSVTALLLLWNGWDTWHVTKHTGCGRTVQADACRRCSILEHLSLTEATTAEDLWNAGWLSSTDGTSWASLCHHRPKTKASQRGLVYTQCSSIHHHFHGLCLKKMHYRSMVHWVQGDHGLSRSGELEFVNGWWNIFFHPLECPIPLDN